MRRRGFLQGLGAVAGLAGTSVAYASAPTASRLVVVVLRGGLDGLAALPAHGDPAYASARGTLALPTEDVLDLDGTFGMHPALSALQPLVARKELVALHAVSPPYQERSHFDGQDVLENGTERPFGARTGWLNRALQTLDAEPPAMAVGRTVPLLLRGPARAASVDPLRRPRERDGWWERVEALYGADPLLGPALSEGLQIQARLAPHQPQRARGEKRGEPGAEAARVVARVLSAEDGPRVAVLEMGGWDTHANQSRTLQRQLDALGGALAAFGEAMTPDVWRRTVVLAVTEFGRTVAPNGTRGSDHGVGGAAFLLGGAVKGGRVLADWPGLRSTALLEGRDLRPTTDLRSVFKGVLHDHLEVPQQALDSTVFPGSARTPRMRGLLRG